LVSSERLSIKFFAIRTLIPCMNFSDDLESCETTEIQTINRDLDQVRSLLLSQSKEFLIDVAVVEKATQKYDKSSSSELRSSKDETF
jgi:hypothetical protein